MFDIFLHCSQARQLLEDNDWDFQTAVTQHFDPQGHELGGDQDEDFEETTAPVSVPAQASGRRLMGGRRLGDESASDPSPSNPPTSSTPQSTRRPPQQKKKFASLKDLAGDAHGHDHDDDDSDKDQEYYAGGDKSGLAVQEPGANRQPGSGGHNEHIRQLLDRARRSV